MSLYYSFKVEKKTKIRRLLIFMEIREISIVLFVTSGCLNVRYFKLFMSLFLYSRSRQFESVLQVEI